MMKRLQKGDTIAIVAPSKQCRDERLVEIDAFIAKINELGL